MIIYGLIIIFVIFYKYKEIRILYVLFVSYWLFDCCWEFILVVGMYFSGYCRCGYVVFVERLNKKWMYGSFLFFYSILYYGFCMLLIVDGNIVECIVNSFVLYYFGRFYIVECVINSLYYNICFVYFFGRFYRDMRCLKSYVVN